MTCIAGIVDRDGVIIGADSAGSAESGFIIEVIEPKVFSIKNILFGVSNSFKIIQTIKTFLKVDDEQDDNYLVEKLIPSLRDVLIENNATQQSNIDVEAEMLIGYRGKLYYLSSDFALMETPNGFHAIGSGMPYAMAAFYQSIHLGWSPILRLKSALECAEVYNCYVRKPWNILKIDLEGSVCSESM